MDNIVVRHNAFRYYRPGSIFVMKDKHLEVIRCEQSANQLMKTYDIFLRPFTDEEEIVYQIMVK